VIDRMNRHERLSPVQRWLANLLGTGRRPVIEVLVQKGVRDVTEAVWIDRLRREGVNLLNVDSVVP
jgi:hypothetical protein